jgi:glycosyltransferase involved in cell wall biosynthesis
MKVAVCSTFVPFVRGGGRLIVDWLAEELGKRGHQVEKVYLVGDEHPDRLITQMMSFRWIDLDDADRIICIRPQAHLIQHDHKTLWFIHHIRSFYDLWDSPYRGFEASARRVAVRDSLREIDTAAIREARHVFTNSSVVAQRLADYNNVRSEVLYPPVYQPERFHSAGHSDEIVCVSRVEHHKRQHLLVEALAHTKTPVKLRILGTSLADEYPTYLRSLITDNKLEDRVTYADSWITEQEKVAALSSCLAAAYLPIDEDSYGYPTVEAAHSSKPTLTVHDSGGVMEFVTDGENGVVADPDPRSVAEAMDRLFTDRLWCERLGRASRERVGELGIEWDSTIERLLQ